MTDIDLTPARWPLMLQSTEPEETWKSVTAPFDDAPIAEVAACGPAHAEAALGAAHALYRERDHWLPLHERVAVLERTAALM
ncbi:MAG: hypothetical protein HKO62_03870, partial [Gammaproteobacteria bacterium]|nr:hypothetical protein [Gammaproteobacteria bacterium]